MGLISNGSTIFDAGAMASGFGGSLSFLSKQTASSSSSISFTSGINSTFKEYLFIYNNIHPATGNTQLRFQANADGASGFNETITSTAFLAFMGENGHSPTLGYEGGRDQAQGTGFQQISGDVGNDNDQVGCGYLHLFNPASTTFVKHYIARASSCHPSDRENDFHSVGYFNTTSAIDEIQFKMSSGNIDSGTICLYGIG